MLLVERLTEEAVDFCRQSGRPLVTLSYAQSLDGCLTLERGRPLALSGPEALILTHRLRAAHAAILVGIGTVLADNPSLTVRLAPGKSPQPIVLDSHLRIPLEANLLHGPRQLWVAALAASGGMESSTSSEPYPSTSHRMLAQKRAALVAAGVRVLSIPADPEGHIALPALLERLAGEGITSLMVEGGANVITQFLAAGLVDQVVITVAPVWVGGLQAIESPLKPVRIQNPGYEQLGEDLVVWGKLARV